MPIRPRGIDHQPPDLHVAGDVVLWPNLTGAEVLDALAGLRGARRPDVEADLIGRFDFDPDKRVRTYSKGTGRSSR